MLTYCTYCSAEKETSIIKVPAIERYKSSRITAVNTLAKNEGVNFIILSGKYGILDIEQEIDYYDHLLIASEVEKHVQLVSAQLREKKVSKIIFYMNSLARDQHLKPYLDCITLAAAMSSVQLEIKVSYFVD